MKKFLLLFIFIILISGSYVCFASEPLEYVTVEGTNLPKTYVNDSISLFSTEKTLEEVLVDGWSNLEQVIDVSAYNISVSDIGDIYQGTLFSNPLMYYVSSGYRYSYYPHNNMVAYVLPIYTEQNPAVIADTLAAIDAETEEILMYLDEGMTDFEKVLTVHDYMVLHYEYDYTYSNYDITIMTTKTGVCMSYTLAFKHLMDVLGIECLYVASPDGAMNHSWNIVKLDGKWYHIDLTWDDAGAEFGVVSHKYALLSDDEIQHLEDPHYGYDLSGLKADSYKYDKDSWHEGNGAVVTIDKIYYYVDGNNIVNQNGKVIYENLDGGDGYWDIGDGYVFPKGKYAGLAEYNGILYFNTDEAVYSYNPETEKINKILEYYGICGLFIDKNTLEYCRFDRAKSHFVEAGKYSLGKIRFGGTFHDDKKIIKRMYKESDSDDIYVYANCGDCIQMEKITGQGVSKITFDAKECQTLFYWDENMKPLSKKEVYN